MGVCVLKMCVCVCDSSEMWLVVVWWCGGVGVGVQGNMVLNSFFFCFCFFNIKIYVRMDSGIEELRYVRHN